MKIIFELPFYDRTCGGVLSTMDIAKHLDAHVRFQNKGTQTPEYKNVSYGIGYNNIQCDTFITYSDNPHMRLLNGVCDTKILMQSYGMAKQERYNATQKFADVLCTTDKIAKLIAADGGNATVVGFGVDKTLLHNFNKPRGRYVAILYHDMESKKYSTAVKVVDMLYNSKVIDGVYSFGGGVLYNKFRKPKGLIKHYHNATREQVSEVFNKCMCYLSPSVSEGLNLTPIESTLCGCPSVICDGDIGGVLLHNETCFIAGKENIYEMIGGIEQIFSIFADCSDIFMQNMVYKTKDKDWGVVANKIYELCKK